MRQDIRVRGDGPGGLKEHKIYQGQRTFGLKIECASFMRSVSMSEDRDRVIVRRAHPEDKCSCFNLINL